MKFSFDRYKGAAAKLLHDRVREVQVVDPGRVRFHLKEPWPDFMTFYGTSATGAAWIVPKKYVEKVGEDGFKKAPIGAGPYRVVSFTPGVELVMEAFEGYWRKVPSVKRLVFRSMPDETTRAAALKAGDVDIVVPAERAHRRGGEAHAGPPAGRRDAARRGLPRPARAVGPEVAVARPCGCGRPPAPRWTGPRSTRPRRSASRAPPAG